MCKLLFDRLNKIIGWVSSCFFFLLGTPPNVSISMSLLICHSVSPRKDHLISCPRGCKNLGCHYFVATQQKELRFSNSVYKFSLYLPVCSSSPHQETSSLMSLRVDFLWFNFSRDFISCLGWEGESIEYAKCRVGSWGLLAASGLPLPST